jgi:hypothetical protein
LLILSAVGVTLCLGADELFPESGARQMNEISIVITCLIAGTLWAVMAYSVGFKEGERQGYTRGRAVSRHISQLDQAAK